MKVPRKHRFRPHEWCRRGVVCSGDDARPWPEPFGLACWLWSRRQARHPWRCTMALFGRRLRADPHRDPRETAGPSDVRGPSPRALPARARYQGRPPPSAFLPIRRRELHGAASRRRLALPSAGRARRCRRQGGAVAYGRRVARTRDVRRRDRRRGVARPLGSVALFQAVEQALPRHLGHRRSFLSPKLWIPQANPGNRGDPGRGKEQR
jgi:hypothetical protein